MANRYALPGQQDLPDRMSDTAWKLMLLLVGLLALSIRWYYVSHALVYHPIRGDAVQYHAYAWNLARHGVFSMDAPGSPIVRPDSFRDPGYPLFLAAWMKLFDDFDAWYAAVLVAQCCLGALTVVLLSSAARGWIRDRWLVGASVLMALWPHSVTMTSFVLSETLFGFLCASAIWILALAVRKSSDWLAATSGIVFSLSALTNAIMLPFALLLAPLLFWRGRARAGFMTFLIAGSLVLPAGWVIRNVQLPPGSSSSGRALLNLVQGSWPEYHLGYQLAVRGDPEGNRILQTINRESDLMVADPAAGVRQLATRMAAAPLHYMGWYLCKPALLWGWSIRMGQGDIYVYPTAHSPFNENPAMRVLVSVCQAINPLIMLFALAGLALAIRRCARNAVGFSVAVMAAYVTFVYAALQAEPRYSIPFRGFECLLAAYAADVLAGWVSTHKASAAGGNATEA